MFQELVCVCVCVRMCVRVRVHVCACACACVCMHTQLLSHVGLFATPWTAALQAPLSMESSRQEYRSELPFPPPGHLPSPGTEPASPASPVLAGGFFTNEPPGKLRERAHT